LMIENEIEQTTVILLTVSCLSKLQKQHASSKDQS